MARARFSPEQIEWLRQQYPRWRRAPLTARFNAQFGTRYTLHQIANIIQRQQITSGRPNHLVRGERPPAAWTPDLVDWLRRERPTGTLQQITDRLNARFGTRFSTHAVNGACTRLSIRSERDTRFKPGARPWNHKQRIKQQPGSMRTQFQPGTRICRVPIGSYRQDPKGYWKLKVSDTAPAGYSRRDWRYVHHLTYIAHHGPIPRGHIVIFLDGDNTNCLDPDNLICIDRHTHAMTNQMSEPSDAPEIRRLVIHTAKVRAALAKAKRRSGAKPEEATA